MRLPLVVASVLAPSLVAPILLAQSASPPAGAGVRFGGGSLAERNAPDGPSPADQAAIDAALAAYESAFGPVSTTGTADASAPPLPFFPMSGWLYEDLYVRNFVDLDPTFGILDYLCGSFTYNTHAGIDAHVPTFEYQTIGVPVYAALDGTVIVAIDGYFDMETVPVGQPSNVVAIDHGGGWVTWYFHLKKNSVAVTVGQPVKSGQQIGLVGSSGNSSGPHLHFGIDLNGVPVEPFAGPCNPNPNLWANPVLFPTTPYCTDIGLFDAPSQGYPNPPLNPFPRIGQIAKNSFAIYYWFRYGNLPANGTVRTWIEKPNGSVAFDSGTPFSLGNPQPISSDWLWIQWFMPFPSPFDVNGTYRLHHELQGVEVANVPFEVVDVVVPGTNSAPRPITAVLEPAVATVNDPLVCRVTSPVLSDDPDFDVVSHRFLWRANGAVVRDVVNAARSDVLAHHVAPPGALVVCEVTPKDATHDGPTTKASRVLTTAAAVPFDSVAYPNSGRLAATSPVSVSAGTASFFAACGPPGQAFTLGYSDDNPSEIPLSLLIGGNPGSFVIDVATSGFLLDPAWVFDAQGRVAFTVAVPPTPAIIGNKYPLQWLAFEPSTTTFVLSNGLRVTIAP